MITNIKKSQHNLKLIRRFQEDIWGTLSLRNKPSQVLNYLYEAYQNTYKYKKLLRSTRRSFFLVRKKEKFAYKVVTGEKEFKRKKRTLKINNYLNLLKLRRFYGNLGKKKFRRSFINLALNPQVTTQSFAYFLESRLDVVLFRANFFHSIFFARQYINHKKVYVNGFLVTKPGFRLKIDDVISIKDPALFYNIIKNNLSKNKILGNYPNYLYVNYKLGIIKFIRLPLNTDVPFPFFMNISTMTNNFSK